MSVNEILATAPYFDEHSFDYLEGDISPEKYYESYCNLKTTLETRLDDDPHLLNKANVTGLWLLTVTSYDGRPQLVIRLSDNFSRLDSYNSLFLNSEIGEFAFHDILHYIDNIPSSVNKDILGGYVVTIFDKER